MPRPKNPLGNPVSIQKRGEFLDIRCYPNGVVGDPSERRWLNAKFPLDTAEEVIQTVAEQLRTSLIAHRSAHGQGTVDELHAVTTREAVDAFVRSLEQSGNTPVGTSKAIQSRLSYNLSESFGNILIAELSLHTAEIVEQVDKRKAIRSKALRKEGTRNDICMTLGQFGAWAVSNLHIPDPFKNELAKRQQAAPQRKRQRAMQKVDREDPFVRDEQTLDIESVDPDSLPDRHEIERITKAVYWRASTGSVVESNVNDHRSNRCAIDPDAARQTSRAIFFFFAATGLRECEALAAHTSRIRISQQIVRIDRQLDRYEPWDPGQRPPLTAPKHNIERNAVVWPEFIPMLRELVAYADEFNEGWLFAPTAGQRWWADAFPNLIKRATQEQVDLGQSPWTHRLHSLRHFYASHSLAGQEHGGQGWSVPFVSRSLGHASEETTKQTYRHIISGEWEAARKGGQSILAFDDED